MLDSQGVKTIWDISTWEIASPNGWDGWQLPDYPTDLKDDKIQLLQYLSGSALIARSRKDRRGWGNTSGKYTMTEGYNNFSIVSNVPKDPTI